LLGFGKKIIKKNRYKSKISLWKSITVNVTKDWKWRIDVEEFNWVWGVHIQDMKNSNLKYFYNYSKWSFFDKSWNIAPNNIQKLKNNDIIKKSLEKVKNMYLDITKEIWK
jgi:hypothetical protein